MIAMSVEFVEDLSRVFMLLTLNAKFLTDISRLMDQFASIG
jgi:hypothetical protein